MYLKGVISADNKEGILFYIGEDIFEYFNIENVQYLQLNY
jgi:hypothetical protein